jgi:hypothetical protein
MVKYKYSVSIQTKRDYEPNDYEYVSDYILYNGEPNGDYHESKDNLDDMYSYFLKLFNGNHFEIWGYELQEEMFPINENQSNLF